MSVAKYTIVNPNDPHPFPESHKITVRAAEAGDYMTCFWALDHKPQSTITIDFDWKTGVAAKDWTNVAKKGTIDIHLSLSLSSKLFSLPPISFIRYSLFSSDDHRRRDTDDHRPPLLSLAGDPNPNPLFLSSSLSPSHNLNPFISRSLIPIYHFRALKLDQTQSAEAVLLFLFGENPPPVAQHGTLAFAPMPTGVASLLGKRSMSFSAIEVCDHETNGVEDDLSDDGSQAGEKKRRLNLEQVKTLEKNFELGNKLESERKMQLARALGLQPRQIAIWFQNRRARWKTKQLEKDYDVLKRQFDAIKDDNDALQSQNQKLQAEV
ncbi:hypothetical protein HYC85_019762 [Camellia sinensis]|uniref:Homeobox-leucine zipper protein n=2 Tax=Camellia sinensis TaxID=4442 RepID=A0A7J7GN43_CAMSI|nr:hypothetical protein HYC85_019762 [Camellia sinensis]